MFAVVFAIVTLWTPDAIASPAAHISDKLPASVNATGITSSAPLDATPALEVCTFGGSSLDGFSFARAADVARAASLPACRSNFDAEQRRAMFGTYVPSLATLWTLPSPAYFRSTPILISTTPSLSAHSANLAPSVVFAPSLDAGHAGSFSTPNGGRSAFRVPLQFGGITSLRGSFGVLPATGPATRTTSVVSHRPVSRSAR